MHDGGHGFGGRRGTGEGEAGKEIGKESHGGIFAGGPPIIAIMDTPYESREPPRGEVDLWPGAVLLEFGTAWCGHCRAAKPHVEAALREHPGVRHVRIADGSGRPLGRSFRVKLWPTLVFLHDGAEVERLVRPGDAQAIRAALARIDPPGGPR